MNMSRADSSAPPQEGDCYVKLPAGQNLEQYARCVGALFPPETAARISQVASEHVRRAQDQKSKSSDPASRPSGGRRAVAMDSNPKAPSGGDSELAKKLRDAQQQLEKRFGSSSSSKESRGRYDSALLERNETGRAQSCCMGQGRQGASAPRKPPSPMSRWTALSPLPQTLPRT